MRENGSKRPSPGIGTRCSTVSAATIAFNDAAPRDSNRSKHKTSASAPCQTAGVGAPPPPTGAIGLHHFALRLPDAGARDRVAARIRAAGIAIETSEGGLLVRDPAHNAILLTV